MLHCTSCSLSTGIQTIYSPIQGPQGTQIMNWHYLICTQYGLTNDIGTDRQMNDIHANRQRYRQAGMQTDRQTDRQGWRDVGRQIAHYDFHFFLWGMSFISRSPLQFITWPSCAHKSFRTHTDVRAIDHTLGKEVLHKEHELFTLPAKYGGLPSPVQPKLQL